MTLASKFVVATVARVCYRTCAHRIPSPFRCVAATGTSIHGHPLNAFARLQLRSSRQLGHVGRSAASHCSDLGFTKANHFCFGSCYEAFQCSIGFLRYLWSEQKVSETMKQGAHRTERKLRQRRRPYPFCGLLEGTENLSTRMHEIAIWAAYAHDSVIRHISVNLST